MAILNNILEGIGVTPLVRLTKVIDDLPIELYGKVEAQNPGGSVKDRIALAMIDAAAKAGQLKPGSTIIEATAGNTGVGLAMVAAVRGYRCVFVMPAKMSQDKVDLLRAYGAEVIRTDNAPPTDPRNFQNVARRLAEENGWFLPDQFQNPANPDVHFRCTGQEILNDLNNELDYFICGVGTGGSISGIGRALKEANPNIKNIVADPDGSILHGGPDGAYQLEGIGVSKIPANYNGEVVDDFQVVTDQMAFAMCRRLAREEGLLVGGAAGCAVAGAIAYAQRKELKSVRIVALLPDTGRNYLSKIFNDQWMKDMDLL